MSRGINVEISLRCRSLIDEFRVLYAPKQSELTSAPATLDLDSLLLWFDDSSEMPSTTSKSTQEIKHTLMSLRNELLHDLCASMKGNEATSNDVKDNLSFKDKMKFICLTAAGILVAACEGFDSVVTLMSIFSLPSLVILTTGIIFSFFSVIAFCGFDLIKLSNSFGIKLSDAHKLLDLYLQQLEEIKLIRKKIANYNLAAFSSEELEQLKRITLMLQQRFKQLADAGKQFELVLNNSQMQVAKAIFSGIAASLFFGGGFCGGQTVSLYVLSLVTVGITSASLPVIIFSLVVGLAAFSLYWCVEFPGLKTLISGWFGLNEKKIAVLCDQELFAKEENKLNSLKEKIISISQLKEEINQYKPIVKEELLMSNHTLNCPESPSTAVGVGNNIYSFMRPRKVVETGNELSPEIKICC